MISRVPHLATSSCCDIFLQSCGAQPRHCHRRMINSGLLGGTRRILPPPKRYPLHTERVWVPRKLAKPREPDLRILHAAAHPLADVLDFRATFARELGGRAPTCASSLHGCCVPEVRASDSCSLLAIRDCGAAIAVCSWIAKKPYFESIPWHYARSHRRATLKENTARGVGPIELGGKSEYQVQRVSSFRRPARHDVCARKRLVVAVRAVASTTCGVDQLF